MKRVYVLGLLLCVSGCATEAYRTAENECSPAAWRDYPVKMIQTIQTRQRVIQVGTGLKNCSTVKEGNQTRTVCTEVTRPEWVTYQDVAVVDQNEEVRKMTIQTCAQNLCLQRYGNTDCETDTLQAPVPATTPASVPVP